MRPDVFEAQLRTLLPDLLRVARWLGGNAVEAEDVVQATLLRGWRNLHALREPDRLKAWLFTILRREHARRFRQQRPTVQLNEGMATQNQPDIVRSLAVRQALGRLEEQYREPLVLAIVTGLACGEIGEIMGLSKGAVMTRLSRARQLLREELADVQTHRPSRVGARDDLP